MDWQPIKTAPKDGTPVRAKRVYGKRVIYDGPAVWRQASFPALYDELRKALVAPAEIKTGWMRVDQEHLVPTPTHWMPLLPPP